MKGVVGRKELILIMVRAQEAALWQKRWMCVQRVSKQQCVLPSRIHYIPPWHPQIFNSTVLLNLIVIASSNNLKPLGLTRLEVVSLNLSSAQYETTLKQFDLIEWPHVLQHIIFQTFLFPNPNSLYWQTVHWTLPAVFMVILLNREWWTVIDGFLLTSLVLFYLFTWCTVHLFTCSAGWQ